MDWRFMVGVVPNLLHLSEKESGFMGMLGYA